MRYAGSRRQFVGGAVATGAVIGGMALFGRGSDPLSAASDRVAVVPGRMPSTIAFDPAAADQWQALVGQPVRIGGEQGDARGVVESVLPVGSKGKRPAGIRAQGFTVTFLTDRATAPVGNAIYDIGHTVEGLSRLFLIRGADRGAQAVLFAFFN